MNTPVNTQFNITDQELAAATGGVELTELFKSMGPITKLERRVIQLTPQQQKSLNQH